MSFMSMCSHLQHSWNITPFRSMALACALMNRTPTRILILLLPTYPNSKNQRKTIGKSGANKGRKKHKSPLCRTYVTMLMQTRDFKQAGERLKPSVCVAVRFFNGMNPSRDLGPMHILHVGPGPEINRKAESQFQLWQWFTKYTL